jgi:hypothetical protein
VTTEVIHNMAPLNKVDYPDITYWTKRSFQNEKNRQEEFSKGRGKDKGKGKKPGHRPKDNEENIRFWHFEEEDGTVLDRSTVSDI